MNARTRYNRKEEARADLFCWALALIALALALAPVLAAVWRLDQ